MPLTIASVIIWGIILYNIIAYFTLPSDPVVHKTGENTLVTADEVKVNQTDELKILEYEKLPRDPFLFAKTKNQRVAKKIRRKKKPDSPPIKYRINGIVLNNNSRLVVFEDLTNKKTLFLREGEAYSDIQIKKISETNIILTERGEKKEILIYTRQIGFGILP
jgi:hypothetical protein